MKFTSALCNDLSFCSFNIYIAVPCHHSVTEYIVRAIRWRLNVVTDTTKLYSVHSKTVWLIVTDSLYVLQIASATCSWSTFCAAEFLEKKSDDGSLQPTRTSTSKCDLAALSDQRGLFWRNSCFTVTIRKIHLIGLCAQASYRHSTNDNFIWKSSKNRKYNIMFRLKNLPLKLLYCGDGPGRF